MASQIIKYVGRTTDFSGKPLWELLGNLKNFGVGRLVIRQKFQRYPEPCFMKIVKVEAQPNNTDPNEARKVKVWVEKTFRGHKIENLVQLHSTSYKADYQLIPKDKEHLYTVCVPVHNEKILSPTFEFPPLLREFIAAETGNPNPPLPTKIIKSKYKTVRIAEKGETPNVIIGMGLGIPTSSSLYKGLDL